MNHAFEKFLKLLFLFLFLVSNPSNALEFKENIETGEITAFGKVEIYDDEVISKIITLEFKQRHRNVRGLTTLNLNSQGGSLLGGLRLGYALRRLGVHTNVGINQQCMSACALAFLGGQTRTVEGLFGVHAASYKQPTKETGAASESLTDSIQWLGAITTSYVNEMTEKTDLAILALSTSANRISILSDGDLVSMNVITMARRPSQFGKPGFKCPAKHDFSVLSTVCVYIDIARLDQKLNTLYTNIKKSGAPINLSFEQDRWRRYRNSCINDGQPNGYDSIVHCVRESYNVRHDQLTSIWLALSTKQSRPGLRDWKPLEPLH